MATQSNPSTPAAGTHRTDTRTASLTGLYTAVAGIAVFNVAPFLDWFTDQGDDTSMSGYEADSLIPFIAYLGIGFAVAMFIAAGRAERNQHRGLTLAAMAVGAAATLQTIATIIDIPGSVERGSDLSTEIGVYVALVGALVWTVGTGLLAKEVEGDPEHDTVLDVRDKKVGKATTQGAKTTTTRN